MERWIWFLGMAVFYGVLFLWFLNQVKKPDYKKNYVLVKTVNLLPSISIISVPLFIILPPRYVWLVDLLSLK